MLEHDLRAALAEDAGRLHAPHDLVDRVVRLSRRRQRIRLGLSAVAAVLAISLTGLAVTLAERAAPAENVDPAKDVVARYMPPGLGKARASAVRQGRLEGRSLTWGEGDRLVRVSWYPIGAVQLTDPEQTDVRPLGLLAGPRPISLRGRKGWISADGLDVFWRDLHATLVRVTVGRAQAGELTSIIRGLLVPDPSGGVFDGIQTRYVPEDVYLGGPSAGLPNEWLVKAWTGENGRWLRLGALRGSRAHSLGGENSPGTLTGVRRTTWRSKEALSAAITLEEGLRGRAFLWVEEPGRIYLVAAGGGAEDELDRFRDGIERVVSPPGYVDGFPPPYLPESISQVGSTEKSTGSGWTGTHRRWTAPGDPGRYVSLAVYRGATGGHWLNAYRAEGGGEWRETTLAGYAGMRSGNCFVSWHDWSRATLRICVSSDLAGQLETVVKRSFRQPPP